MPSQSRHGYGIEFHHKLQTQPSHTSPNTTITHVSKHKQQQVAPAKKKNIRCISLVVTEDTWVVVTSEQGYQAESENGLQFSLRVDMPGSLAQRCRAFLKMLCNAMSNCQWFPLSCIRTPQQLLHLRRTCLWHYRNGDAGYGSITSRTTDSETNWEHLFDLAWPRGICNMSIEVMTKESNYIEHNIESRSNSGRNKVELRSN